LEHGILHRKVTGGESREVIEITGMESIIFSSHSRGINRCHGLNRTPMEMPAGPWNGHWFGANSLVEKKVGSSQYGRPIGAGKIRKMAI
jgi:hypothetical protein